MNNPSKPKLKITGIPVSKLKVLYPECQRPYDDRWATKIAQNFDPDLFDPITVSGPDEEGFYHIIKGQHRVSAVRKLWPGEDQLVPCVVVAADQQRAAKIFLDDVDNKKRISAVDRFNVAVTARFPEEVEVSEILKSCGQIISVAHTDNSIFAVTAIMYVYKTYGPITLRRTIETLIATWPGDRTAFQRSLILGYGLFLHTRSTKINWVQLRTCMQTITPTILGSRGKATANKIAKTLSIGMELEILEAYNKFGNRSRGRPRKHIPVNGTQKIASARLV